MAFERGSVEQHVQAVIAALTGIVLSQHAHLLENGTPVGVEDSEDDEEWEVALLSISEPNISKVKACARGFERRATRGRVSPITRERRSAARRKV